MSQNGQLLIKAVTNQRKVNLITYSRPSAWWEHQYQKSSEFYLLLLIFTL